MAVKLRLTRAGAHKRPVYWIVAADSRMARDGRFLEKLGTYNPRTEPRSLTLKSDRIHHWLDKGATPTAAVRELLRDEGILKARVKAPPAGPQDENAPAPAE